MHMNEIFCKLPYSFHFVVMKFTLCIVALAIMVSVEAKPATEPIVIDGEDDQPNFFTDKLESVQGAIYDTLRAGKDLQDMEGALQNIVDASSYFFKTESATEYAVQSTPYGNNWTT